MNIRLPNPRYIGDGVYVRHDGDQLFLETSNGFTVKNSIAVNNEILEGLRQYQEYLQDFYGNGQHNITPNCEDCGSSLRSSPSPIQGAVNGEIYRIRMDDAYFEVRLCQECARVIDQATLEKIIAERQTA